MISKRLILTSTFLVLFFVGFGQTAELKLTVIAFQIKDDIIANGYVHDRIDYWLTSQDRTTSFDSLTRFYFSFIYAGNTIDKCSKGDTLGAGFYFVTNMYLLNRFDEMEKQLVDSANLISSFQFDKKVVYVYAASIKGPICKCSYRGIDREVIPMYVPINSFEVNSLNEQAKRTLASLDYTNCNFSFFRNVEPK